jgi:hypothetical protein
MNIITLNELWTRVWREVIAELNKGRIDTTRCFDTHGYRQ